METGLWNFFVSTLNPMIYLFSFILAGFGALKTEPEGVLSKPENTLSIPALVVDTFMRIFIVETLDQA